MLKNFFVTAFNNYLKNGLFSLINIAGLSIGLAACILIALYVLDETSYDKHWANADRIYRLNSTYDFSGDSPRRYSGTSFLALPALRNAFGDQIELGSRIVTGPNELINGDQRFEEVVDLIEAEYLQMFPLNSITGDLAGLTDNPDNIALREDVALRIFGTVDVIGNTITTSRGGDTRDNRIAAVFRLPAENSVIEPAVLRLMDTAALAQLESWTAITTDNFIQFSATADVDAINAQLPAFTDQYADISNAVPGVRPSERMGHDLQNIREIHLNSPFDTQRAGGNRTVVTAFSAIAVLVLLIGCINFTLLSTAKATQRAREVGMRKAVGASRSELILQFLGESFLIVVPAVMLALVLAELSIPVFESLVGSRLNIHWLSLTTWLALGSLAVIVSITGGLYPAFVMSRFRPSRTLMANRSSSTGNSARLRSILVIFQFGVSIALIIATAVIFAQVRYAANRDPGFNRENMLVVDNLLFRADANAQKRTLKEAVTALPGVSHASLSVHQPTQRDGMANNAFTYELRGENAVDNVSIATVSVDTDFFKTYQIPLLSGRNFDTARDREVSLLEPPAEGARYPVILNESAARQLGFAESSDAVGRQLLYDINGNEFDSEIVGVVADTQFFSMRTPTRPEVFIYSPGFTDVLHVRYQGDPGPVLAGIGELWRDLVGDAALSTSFVDANMAAEFDQEQTEANILLSFSLLAVVIACLGLYGSASFTVDRRTKEIGIRKVMGAEIRDIVTLLVWEFSLPVVVSNFLAWPAAAWAMLTWLQQFPFRIDTLMLVPFCVFAGALTLSIAWLTVAGNTITVASRKPVLALRYE